MLNLSFDTDSPYNYIPFPNQKQQQQCKHDRSISKPKLGA
jgi:hypothetical protein